MERSGEIGQSKKQHRQDRETASPEQTFSLRWHPSLCFSSPSPSIRQYQSRTEGHVSLNADTLPHQDCNLQDAGKFRKKNPGIKVINPKRTTIGVFAFKLRKPRYCPCGGRPELTEAPVPQQLLFSGSLCSGVQAEVQDLFFIESSSSSSKRKSQLNQTLPGCKPISFEDLRSFSNMIN